MTKKNNKTKTSKKPNKSMYWIIGGVLIVVLLATTIFALFSNNNSNDVIEDVIVQKPTTMASFAQAVANGVETGNGNGDLEDDDPSIGDPNAPVVIIEFSDFQCPYCGAAEGSNQAVIDYIKQRDATWTPAIPSLITEYVETGKVRVVFRDFAIGGHPFAQKAAEASECADDQGKYWEYHDTLFENQKALTIENLKAYAEELGLDTAEFNECLDSGKHEQEVKDDFTAGSQAGVTGTPAFFINGKLIAGAYPYSAFKKVVDEALVE